jgi:hypothetical protein
MNNTIDFSIRALTVIDGRPNTSGNRLLARFDLETTGVIVTGCVLVAGEDGSLKVGGPRGKCHTGTKISARFVGSDMADAVKRRASEIYELFSGRRPGAE